MSGAAGKRHQSGRNATRYTLMASLVEEINKEDILNGDEFKNAEMERKVGLLSEAIIKVNNTFNIVHDIINNATDGLDPRASDCEEKVQHLTEENKHLRFELDVLKGLFTKMESENTQLRDKVTILTAQNMKNNILIGGLTTEDETAENSTEAVVDFFQDKLSLEFPTSQVITARRIGFTSPKNPSVPRQMLVSLHPALRELVFGNLKKLKDKKNANGNSYRISKQLPEQWAEENRSLRAEVAKAKKDSDAKAAADQQPDEIEVRRRTLYINKVPQKKVHISAPTAREVFPDKTEQDKLDKLKFHASTVAEHEGSTFTAFAIKLQSVTEVKRAYVRMRQLHPSASHIVAAFSAKNAEGFNDDREYGSGHRALNTITSNGYTNVATFTVRYHEGQNIGPRPSYAHGESSGRGIDTHKNQELHVNSQSDPISTTTVPHKD